MKRMIKPIKHNPFASPINIQWYYVVARSGNKTMVDRQPTEQAAYALGYKLNTEFKVIPLHTRDVKRAKAIIRDMKLWAGEGLDEAMKPIYRIKEQRNIGDF
jgi:hypothetical protein